MKIFLKHAMKRDCVLRSLKVAVIVGTILAIINHYDAIFYRDLTKTDIIQILITYLVPYSVATYGSASEARCMELKFKQAERKE